MAAEDKLPANEKLDDANWPIWKLQMSAYFEARDLWGLVTGEEVQPPPTAEA